MVYIFLADGFEIIEAMAPVDMLRRAGIEVKMVGVGGSVIQSSCGVKITADISEEGFSSENAQAIIIPGGMSGVKNLEASSFVQNAIDKAAEKETLICAICAGPSILGHKGLLNGKSAVCYPGFEEALAGAVLSDEFVVTDGQYITAKGAGVSVDFGLEIVKQLAGEAAADKVRKAIQCR